MCKIILIWFSDGCCIHGTCHHCHGLVLNVGLLFSCLPKNQSNANIKQHTVSVYLSCKEQYNVTLLLKVSTWNTVGTVVGIVSYMN